MKQNYLLYRTFLIMVTLGLLIPLFSQSPNISIVTEKVDATYQKGETARFLVNAETSGPLSYVIYFGTESNGSTPADTLLNGEITVTGNTPTVIEYTLNEPGVISCKLNNSNSLVASAAFSPLEIEPMHDTPSDFVSFWNAAKDELGDYTPIVSHVADNDASKTYLVELENINNRKVYGYLTVPNGSGPFPAVVQLPPAGNNLGFDGVSVNVGPSPDFAERSGAIVFFISIHNVDPSQSDPNAYEPNSYLDKNDFYYKQAILAGVRAIDYLFDHRNEFNKKDLGVIGASQGAGLATMVAGIDDRVKFLMASNPIACEPLAKKYGKASGHPYFWDDMDLSENVAIQESNFHYYNTVHFAKQYDGPAHLFVSYEDATCPSAGTYAAFNQLQGKKILTAQINLAHQHWEYNNVYPGYISRFLNSTAMPHFDIGYNIDIGKNRIVPFGKTISLSGIVENDDDDVNSVFTYEWSKVEGPGIVNFFSPNKISTNAYFSQEGVYKLQLKAVDKSTLSENEFVEGEYFTTLIDEIIIEVKGNCIDIDGDKICANNGSDCDDNNPSVPNVPGSICDDGNADTTNDIVSEDGCGCAGSPRLVTSSCTDQISIEHGGGQITITGQSGSNYFFKLFEGSDVFNPGNLIKDCSHECGNIISEEVEEGDYIVQVWNGGWQIQCSMTVYVSPTSEQDNTTVEDPDNDGDGIPFSLDCNDFDENIQPETPGTDCNDGDPNTHMDKIQPDGCACIGTYIDPCVNKGGDTDGDGICDDDDCNVSDPDLPTTIGAICNDGNTATINDVIQADGCTCLGVHPCAELGGDADGDGICASEDCNDNDENIPGEVDAICDDGDVTTIDDLIESDGCTCRGIPMNSEQVDCGAVSFYYGNNEVTLRAQSGTTYHYSVTDLSTWTQVTSNSSLTGTHSFELPNGTYRVNIHTNNDWALICSPEITFCIDADGDGTCIDEDCDDNNADLPAGEGTACNDNDANTENDVIQADGCTCAGTIINPCVEMGGDADGDGICAEEDCNDNDPNIPGEGGEICDDGDPNTIDDLIESNGCACRGIPTTSE